MNIEDELSFNRREFLKIAASASIASAFTSSAFGQETRDEIPYRPLGKTGEKVSGIGVGGFHIAKNVDEDMSIKIVRTALDSGINFLDNSWDYNDGQSEIRMGMALKDGYRQKAFLMTKVDGRTKESAAKQIDESLKRLQTDHVDLMQFHEVIRLEDPDRIFAQGGAIEAMIEARKAGKIRYIGFTGHKDPMVHLRMLEIAAKNNFSFDTVQMPLNVMDAHFRSFQEHVLPILVDTNVGVLGMKPMGSGVILESKTVSPVECLHFAMNLPTSTVITGIDSIDILKQDIQAAKTFKPLSEQQVADLLNRTSQAAESGKFELFKTSNRFDSTAKNPQWLG